MLWVFQGTGVFPYFQPEVWWAWIFLRWISGGCSRIAQFTLLLHLSSLFLVFLPSPHFHNSPFAPFPFSLPFLQPVPHRAFFRSLLPNLRLRVWGELKLFGAFPFKFSAFCGLLSEQQFYFYFHIFICSFLEETAAIQLRAVLRHAGRSRNCQWGL